MTSIELRATYLPNGVEVLISPDGTVLDAASLIELPTRSLPGIGRVLNCPEGRNPMAWVRVVDLIAEAYPELPPPPPAEVFEVSAYTVDIRTGKRHPE